MKKLLIILLVMAMNTAFSKEIKLNNPDLNDPFLKMLNNRISTREYDKNKDIDNQTLSNILWSAFGITRKSDDNKRTIPTALNKQDLEIYVIKKNGVWLYDAIKQQIIQISNKNLFKYFNKQDYVDNAPLILLYTSKENEAEDFSLMHAGSAYQNVAIYCAEHNLGNVVRGYFDKDNLAKELNINDDKIITSQVIGYKK